MNSPIGIFDSGLGGLSVAAEVMRQLPRERIIYLADNAHVPYGERPLDQIREFALGITDFLIDRGAKAVVMACNMSSAVALDAARERHPKVPILGVIEPGARAAVNVAGGQPIGVLATTGTVKSGAYERMIQRLDPDCGVIQQACPRFVPLVEEGKAGSEEAEAAARAYVAPILAAGCRTVILGCTHYPFLRRAIESATGESVTIVDPAEETVRALTKILSEADLAGDGPDPLHQFHVTGPANDFAALGSVFLGRRIDSVQSVRWGVELGARLEGVAM